MRNPRCRQVASRPVGFTLLELLVTIAIIAILVGVTLVALRGARVGADRVVSLNALKQIMTGYSTYTNEHEGVLLPGYVKPAILGTNPTLELDLKARLPGGETLTAADTSGYVWRLAPYMNNGYQSVLADYTRGLIKRYENEFNAHVYGPGTVGTDGLGIGFTPSIGYNSIYLGGDNQHGDGMTPSFDPWNDVNPNIRQSTVATLRLSEIQYPTQTIAFATCKAVNMTLPDVGEKLGYVELRPPFVHGNDPGHCDKPQWVIDEDNQLQPNEPYFSGPGGLMVDRSGGRNGDKVPTAFVDGHSELFNPAEFIIEYPLPQDLLRRFDRIIAHWSPYEASLRGSPSP